MVRLKISFPKVSLGVLTSKYGEPKLVDDTNAEICKNRIGNEFENLVGNVDAVWVNGQVSAILRAYKSPPRKTCSDGLTIRYYILEESKQVKIIEKAIDKYRACLSAKEASDSLF